MVNKRQLQSAIRQLDVVETVTRAYGEIASQRMKRTRNSVVVTRDFLVSLQEIFDEVRANYAKEIGRLIKDKKAARKGKITFISHNGKSVAVLLSANTGLYGDIVRKTFDLFLEEVRAGKSEVTVIGKQGLTLFDSVEPNRPRTYFELPDNGFGAEDVNRIIRHIVKYDEIHLYFGKFHNVLTQNPVKVTISSHNPLENTKKAGKRREYVFEPSLEKILMFFEGEIFASVLEQSIRESQLAKFASRIVAMDVASQNIEAQRKKLLIAKFISSHRAADKKQVNSFPAIFMKIR